MSNLKVLIVDDEKPAREKLRRFLTESSNVLKVFEAWNGDTALQVANAEHPDVVFLDIRMPRKDGVTVAEALIGSGGAHIVFVTAYDQHAVRAFELGAVDYLLKPFDRTRFQSAFARVVAAVENETREIDIRRIRETLRSVSDAKPVVERLLVEDGDRSKIVPVRDIVRFEADRNYVRITTAEGVFRIRTTMSDLEERLSPDEFARINRSQIININFVRDLLPAGHGDHEVRMTDGTTARLSRRYRDRIVRWS